MPPSIDPVTNMFATGSSLISRVLISFAAGWLGNFLSRVCVSFTDWSDFRNPIEVLVEAFANVPAEILTIVLWPLVILHYLIAAPFYALILVGVVVLCLYKIILADDPVLFWAVLMVTALTPGMVLASGSLCSIVPLVFFMIGLGAALWYSVNLDHPEWIDQVREWTGM
ncbi:MAG: hypothetical protein P1U89_13785 [Verrucomicrobiales bacterium]|nr:hypothetical protein [Verrucomicrobiales bacterium]